MTLTEAQVQLIRHHVESNITWPAVQDDVLDHLCCVIEGRMDSGETFEAAFVSSVEELSARGLGQIEKQATEMMNHRNATAPKVFLYALGFVGTGLLSIGWLFSVLRWPGGVEMFNSGFFMITIFFMPLLFIDLYSKSGKDWQGKLRMVFGLTSSLTVGLSLVFKLLHLQGADILLFGGVIVWTFGFLPFLFFSMYKRALALR